MAKRTGLGGAFYVEGLDVSGDTNELGRVAGGPSPLEVTGIDKSAYERIAGKLDGGIELTSFFNDASDQAHDAWSGLPTTDVVATYLIGTTLGDPACGLVAKQANYDAARGEDGSLTFDVSLLANGYGLEWGYALTAGIETDTDAANGSAVDRGSASDLGMAAYLHAFDFSGTDVTVTIQDSANGSTGWADVFSFTEITGSTPLAERIVTSSATENVKQYLRAITETDSGFTNLEFAVVAVPYTQAVL